MSSAFVVSYVCLWLLVGFQTLVLVGLAQSVYKLRGPYRQLAAEDLDRVGKPAVDFTTTDVNGATVDSSDYAGQTRALLFVSPSCSSCSLTLDEMWALESKTGGRVIVICQGSQEDCIELAHKHRISVPVVADEGLAVSRTFAVSSVPIAVLVNEDDTIRHYGYPVREESEVVDEESLVGGVNRSGAS